MPETAGSPWCVVHQILLPTRDVALRSLRAPARVSMYRELAGPSILARIWPECGPISFSPRKPWKTMR